MDVSAKETLDFMHTVAKLKRLRRTGWVEMEVKDSESVADHMYRTAVLAMTIKDPNINRDKLVKMLLVHDLAECIIGDITPYQGVSEQEKYVKEQAGMKYLCSQLECNPFSEVMLGLWEEFEEGKTQEAILAKDIDKLEMITTAFEYEAEQKIDLQQFFDYTDGYFKHKEAVAMDTELRRRRADRLNGQRIQPNLGRRWSRILDIHDKIPGMSNGLPTGC